MVSTSIGFEKDPKQEIKIKPAYISVGGLFSHGYVFFVPTYQRGYAWGESEIEDFLNDLDKCYDARKEGSSQHHFFGGVVSVQHSIPGGTHRNKYELVDGQQRIVTFVILMSQVINLYKQLAAEVASVEDSNGQRFLPKRINKLEEMYLKAEIELNREVYIFNTLKLSKSDQHYFQNILDMHRPVPERESHHRLLHAFDSIRKKIDSYLAPLSDISDKLDVLERIEEIVDKDCTVIHIVTYNKKDAYRLFQVLNDRGINLTEGDLLRAKTLEMLDHSNFESHQESIEKIWDDILIDHPNETERFLRWIYESHEATRPGKSTLFDDFLEGFYPQHSSTYLTQKEAKNIVHTTSNLKTEFDRCRGLVKGDWPFLLAPPLTLWHTNRLVLLVAELKHTNCIPLLLAACKLDPGKFDQIVQLTERFFFRYKLICNQHITPLNNIYHKEAQRIHDNPDAYQVASYRTALQSLQNRKASDTTFESLFTERLTYNPGASNKKIKYFLLTAEYYLRWYDNGAVGDPKCYNHERIFDFATTTIEHVYPQTPASSVQNSQIDPLKNSLGNLTILGPMDNKTADNSDFATKQSILTSSLVLMNQRIAVNTDWNQATIQARTDMLQDLAMKVFTV